MTEQRLRAVRASRRSVDGHRGVRSTLLMGVLIAGLAVPGTAALAADGSASPPARLTVGATLPLTGPGAPYGSTMKDGLQVALDEINASGGVSGTQLDLVALDSQAAAGPAVTGMNQLVNVNDAITIVTAFTTPPLAQLPGAEEAQVTLFNGGGNDPSLLGHDWLYNAVLMSDQEARAVMQWAYDELGARSIGIIFETDYTASALDAFRQAWKDVCATCPSTEVSIDNTATDTSPQIQRIMAANPDVIFSTTNGTILQLQLQQMAQLGVTQPILSTSAIFALPEEFASDLGPQLVGVRQPYAPEQAFLDGFAKLHPDQEPNLYTHNYYVIGHIIAQALQRAIEQGYGTDGAALKKALDELNLFTPEHGSTSQAEIVRAVDGQQQVVATVDAPPATK